MCSFTPFPLALLWLLLLLATFDHMHRIFEQLPKSLQHLELGKILIRMNIYRIMIARMQRYSCHVLPSTELSPYMIFKQELQVYGMSSNFWLLWCFCINRFFTRQHVLRDKLITAQAPCVHKELFLRLAGRHYLGKTNMNLVI